MRKLTAKQKKMLFKWAKANPDLALASNPVDKIEAGLYNEIDAINPCEILWQNVNRFIEDLVNENKIDTSLKAQQEAEARREKEKKPRKVISELYDEKKCGGCNWRVGEMFAFEGQSVDEIGLCGNCFSEVLRDGNYQITKNIEI